MIVCIVSALHIHNKEKRMVLAYYCNVSLKQPVTLDPLFQFQH